MGNRKDPSISTIKRLFALSGNLCAYPDCKQAIVETDNTLVGEICHIEAVRPGQPRYNPTRTDEELRAFDNLILLCPTHHKITDNEIKFPVGRMKKMKISHQTKFMNNPYNVPDNILDEAIANLSNKFQMNQNFSGQQVNTQIGNAGTINISPVQATTLRLENQNSHFSKIYEQIVEPAFRISFGDFFGLQKIEGIFIIPPGIETNPYANGDKWIDIRKNTPHWDFFWSHIQDGRYDQVRNAFNRLFNQVNIFNNSYEETIDSIRSVAHGIFTNSDDLTYQLEQLPYFFLDYVPNRDRYSPEKIANGIATSPRGNGLEVGNEISISVASTIVTIATCRNICPDLQSIKNEIVAFLSKENLIAQVLRLFEIQETICRLKNQLIDNLKIIHQDIESGGFSGLCEWEHNHPSMLKLTNLPTR